MKTFLEFLAGVLEAVAKGFATSNKEDVEWASAHALGVFCED